MPHWLYLALLLLPACASSRWVTYTVDSQPRGAVVEANGAVLGTTPCEIRLMASKRWAGLGVHDPWQWNDIAYTVVAYPPPDHPGGLYTQQRIIYPHHNPDGGRLFFDLRLAPVAPIQRIEFR